MADLVRRITPHREALMAATFSHFPPLGSGLRLAAGMPRELVELTRRGVASADAFGKELFAAERPTACGWPYPRGGAQALADALAARLSASGGSVRTDATVERIEVSGGRVRGVVLARGGERVPRRRRGGDDQRRRARAAAARRCAAGARPAPP